MKLYILLALNCTFLADSKSPDTFGAVTNIDGLQGLYLRLRIREPHLDPDTITDAETKKRICQSITKSGFFAVDKKYPLDMDDVYDSTEFYMQHPAETFDMGTPVIYHYRLREDYEKRMFRRARYSYRSRLVTFGVLGSTKKKEFAFTCAVKHRESGSTVLYCISDAYDANAALDVPTDRRIRARFVGEVLWNSICNVVAIAEEPALAFSRKEFSVEDVYLQMRKFYDPVSTAFDDPVCGLTRPEKLRVCASVTASSDFANRVKFLATLDNFEEECEQRTVSLRTDNVVNVYQEWMLSCPVEATAPNIESVFFVSRAYHSHHTVVYIQREDTKKWYIENISANISVIIDRNLSVREECQKLRPPNFDRLLNDSQKSKSGQRRQAPLFLTGELNTV